MRDDLEVFAGDCTVSYDDGDGTRTRRGQVVVLAKPDGTVLVHDAGGYRPAAWLTRADTVSVRREGDEFRLRAGDGAARLLVESHESAGHVSFPVSPAGSPVGDCPACGAVLVRDGDAVACTGCDERHAVPRDATVAEEPCRDCGLPTVTVSRGPRVTVCVDRECDPLADAVDAAREGEWPCPDCGSDMAPRQERGLRAVCPDCERRLALPTAAATGTCDCGLPRFPDRGCLDPDCDAGAAP